MKISNLRKKMILFVVTIMFISNGTVYASENQNANTLRILDNIKILEDVIDEYYLFEKNSEDIEYGLYKGLIDSLGDEYSFFISADEYEQSYTNTDNKYVGVGVQLREDENMKIVVSNVFENSPAEKAGIKIGDTIYSIDGKLTSALDFYSVYDSFEGSEGTIITFEIMEKDTNAIKKIEIKRENVEYKTVIYKMLDNKVAYIKITEFTSKTDKEFENAVTFLKKEGMKKLVLDLRDNQGGSLYASVNILAQILPDKELGYTIDKKGRITTFDSKNGQIISEQKPYVEKDETRYIIGEDNKQIDVPIAIVANGNSASAAELLIGTLKNYNRATVVGERTYGKGIVQNVIAFDDGSALQLTVAYFYSPNGASIHKKGIEPNITVSYDESLMKKGIDVQLDEAIKALK